MSRNALPTLTLAGLYRCRQIKNTLIAISLILCTHATQASTPAEMADLSLQELFALSTDNSNDDAFKRTPWSIGVLYKQTRFEGYQDGSTELSNDEVLWDGIEPRTDKNFPVLPTLIIQQALITTLTRTIDDMSSISISIPLIKQSTDHISIVASYEAFNLTSQGLGDITFNYKRILSHRGTQQINYSLGLSIPTGSIDQKGDTPREAGDQQLPYTMQLGSGTWDIPAAISYQNNNSVWSWGGNLLGKVHLGRNDRNYRLGNRVAVSVWSKWQNKKNFQPVTKLIYQHWRHINGQDDELTVPGPFPYPAGITNPVFYGGTKLNITLGAEIKLSNQTLVLELSTPIYQSLNGVQPKENINFSISWNTAF